MPRPPVPRSNSMRARDKINCVVCHSNGLPGLRQLPPWRGREVLAAVQDRKTAKANAPYVYTLLRHTPRSGTMLDPKVKDALPNYGRDPDLEGHDASQHPAEDAAHGKLQ